MLYIDCFFSSRRAIIYWIPFMLPSLVSFPLASLFMNTESAVWNLGKDGTVCTAHTTQQASVRDGALLPQSAVTRAHMSEEGEERKHLLGPDSGPKATFQLFTLANCSSSSSPSVGLGGDPGAVICSLASCNFDVVRPA